MPNERILPGLNLTGFWEIGSDDWKPGMDANLLSLSANVQPVIIDQRVTLPSILSSQNGDRFITPQGYSVFENGAWNTFTPDQGWIVYDKALQYHVVYQNTAWVRLFTLSEPGEAGADGAATLLQLTDAPSSYTDQAGKILVVNPTETEMVFIDVPVPVLLPQYVTVQNKSADYTLRLSDHDGYIRCGEVTSVDIVVPNNSSTAIPIGYQVLLRRTLAGPVAVVAQTGVTINTAETLTLRKTGSSASLIKVGDDEWDLSGDLEPSV